MTFEEGELPKLTLDDFKSSCEQFGGEFKQVDKDLYACEIPKGRGKLVFRWKNGLVAFDVEGDKAIRDSFKIVREFLKV